MKPSSSPQRLRPLVVGAVLIAFVIVLVIFGVWQHSRSGRDNYRDMVSAFYTGVIALEVGDDAHAFSGLTLATQLDAQEPAAWADLGLYYLRHNNPNEARKALGRAQYLAPKNARILAIMGLLEAQQFHFHEAITAYQQAIQSDPKNLPAHYALATLLDQQAAPGAEAQVLDQYQAIYEAAPDNLFAASMLAVAAAKARNADSTRRVVTWLSTRSASWTPATRQSLTDVQKAIVGPDIRAAAFPLQSLQNLLKETPQYKEDAAAISGLPNTLGTPLDRFVTLPSPSPTPAAPDTALKFRSQPLAVPAPGPWAWARTVLLSGNGAPTLLVANGKEVRVGNVSLPFPGGPKAVPPAPDGIAAFDARNTGLMDLACAGAGGLRLYQQGTGGTFADVTGKAKLPPSIINGAYIGVWAADFITGGQLDLVLGTAGGPPTVLRNNGDGTWAVLHPFGTAKSGLTQWAWADLDGDGLPDAAFADGQGRLVVLQNKRTGAFAPWPLPAGVGQVAALSAADPDRDGTQDVVALTNSGAIRRLSRKTDGSGWDMSDLGYVSALPPDGSARLQWADLDNNGALDLVVADSQASFVWLGDAQGKLVPLAAPAEARNASVDAQAVKGRLDLISLDAQGQPVRLVNTGSKNYAWQEIGMRAEAQGDRRNNTYGIGGEIGLRAGLLYETQIVTGPVTHFGLGTNDRATSVRIVWPNGVPQGEFELKADRLTFPPDRSLKGSCPWLLADDGTGESADVGMKFVTDFIWRSPLGLRINAQDTAGVVQTRDWVKVRGDQLKARGGYYNLRITADLWETHFFDEVKLMTVDHPVGTEVNVDERFSIPPPPLAVDAMTPPLPFVRATDDRGQDVTDVVRARDGRYLDTFGVGEYQGVTRDHWVTLDLGPTLPLGKTWLVGVGWIHPTDSSINVALGQGHHIPPHDLSLEIPDGKGGWKVAKPHLGFPEGKNKTVLIPLAGLFGPGQPHQVRLRTNMEIYWDFLGTAQALPPATMKHQMLSLSDATLRYRGFSATHQASHSSPEIPDYAHLAQTGPRWLDLEGYCTRFGDVRELLTKTDDRYVIMNAGDEMVLRFAAPPPPPAGWTRDYVVIGDGWEKDGDFNTSFSRTVLPLPSHLRPAYNTPPGRLEDDPVYKAHRQDWVTYQTRWVSQRRFHEALRP
jgi:tetratricopeptide (TPR) repeat protein